jgi:ferredoxin--NADP+ reductase
MANLADFNTKNTYKGIITDTKRLTPLNKEEIRELIVQIDDPSFVCKVDQSFGVLVETDGEFGTTKHHRLYSHADLPKAVKGSSKIAMLVKRCSYVDEFNGEIYEGIASNYLCDRKTGDEITITGPFTLPFVVPEDKTANLILIGMGTGIAPFRAFIKNIYRNVQDWQGQIRLFYGAKSGLELLYLNDKDGDLTQYYDEATFDAIQALSPRPEWSDPIALDKALEDRAEEVLELLGKANTHIYVAGYEKVNDLLNKAFANIMGSKEKWDIRKAELIAGRKWAEILY